MSRHTPPRIELLSDTMKDWHDRQDAARRATADHGLGRNAEHFADLGADAYAELQTAGVVVAIAAGGIVCAALGWIARGWWG